ncbi:RNA polymerase IIA largest subunit [Perkinsela sp. CCAP 1560/4]|nr:RNA polymerase IIA largest subunit [Perkinsela sp. CCAP 1560/4]|eukprot:KNH03665.1 RNA polymerase IIA largest subunit [Perkinsela sp. CCAP 1560/4]
MSVTGYAVPMHNCEQRVVTSIDFCAMDKSTIQAMSVITSKDPSQRGVCELISTQNGVPVLHGLCDPRLGSFSPHVICETCTQRYPNCPGHFGHIELVEPMFNVCYFKIIMMILRTICKNCGRSLIDCSHPNFPAANRVKNPRFRLRTMAKICRSRCFGYQRQVAPQSEIDTGDSPEESYGCSRKQPRVKRTDNTLGFDIVYDSGAQKGGVETFKWVAADVLRLFEKVDPTHWEFLGFSSERFRDPRKPFHGNHPIEFILQSIPVPPLHVRPSVIFGGVAASEDDLTHIYTSIIKYNKELYQKKESGLLHEITAVRMQLQLYIAAIVNNNTSYFRKKATSRQGRQMKSIADRLKGKFGRVRQHLMGKRVEFCARSVITGDPCMEVDQVGIPKSVAMTLTFPERVTPFNQQRLTSLVQRGPDVHPGANFIIQPNGDRVSLKNVRSREKLLLAPGSIVERHLLNGDVVLFNRQPTLHRMSMMGHRVRILPHNTFRMNLSTTTPYNADFDGDEMNLHVPQSMLTKAELMEFMMVPKNFINPGRGHPVMGINQDSLTGVYLLTRRDTFIDWSEMQDYVFRMTTLQNTATHISTSYLLKPPAILKPEVLWTGKQIFSMALNGLSVSLAHRDASEENDGDHPDHRAQGARMAPNDASVSIRNGELLHGAVVKSIVGNVPNSLIHVITNMEGGDACQTFMNCVQSITTHYLIHHGFSVGIGDAIPKEESKDVVEQILRSTDIEMGKLCLSAVDNRFKDRRGRTLKETFEQEVNKLLSQCRSEAGIKIIEGYSSTNGFKCMIKAGSKGNDMNISQIGGIVGQQNCEGKRIKFGFRRRTLPCFVRDDYGAESKGYIRNNYLKGLSGPEFFFHSMAGREGLIDTACKTADTGYIQRRIMKICEDLHVAYDGTVRNAGRQIIQFVYGEDGLDGTKVELKQSLQFISWKNAVFDHEFRYEVDGYDLPPTTAISGALLPRFGHQYLSNAVIRSFQRDPSQVNELISEYHLLRASRNHIRRCFGGQVRESYTLGVNFQRLIQTAKERFRVGMGWSVSDLHPIYVIRAVESLLNKCRALVPTMCRGENNHFTKERVATSLLVFNVAVRGLLHSRQTIRTHRLNKQAFDWLLAEVAQRFQRSLIHPGEMVGAIAAQSCGEPATQMTLNTFHFAGVASKNVTLGVPRLRELINATPNPAMSNMIIYLSPELSATRATANDALNLLEYKTVADVVTCVEIHYDPDPASTRIEEDQSLIESVWDWDFLTEEKKLEMQCVRQNASRYILRITLNKTALYSMNIEPDAIGAKIVEKEGRWWYEASEMNANECVLRLRLADESDLHKAAREAQESGVSFDIQDTWKLYRTQYPMLLESVVLAGVSDISKSFITQGTRKYFPIEQEVEHGENRFDMNMDAEEQAEFFIETEGTNLSTVLGLPFVDTRRTVTNNVLEVLQVLGVEAALNILMKEMRSVYEKYGIEVSYRHFAMLAEIMTHRGGITPLTRQGIGNNADANGPLMRATYEQQLEVLMEGAAYSEREEMKGVSANVMLGQSIIGGTGKLFDLNLDEKLIMKAIPQEEAIRAHGVHDFYHARTVLGDDTVFDQTEKHLGTLLQQTHYLNKVDPLVAAAQSGYSYNTMGRTLLDDGLSVGNIDNFANQQLKQTEEFDFDTSFLEKDEAIPLDIQETAQLIDRDLFGKQ